jgi:3-phosphoglycerate kinase
MNKKTIDDINVRDKKVLVRCDFNVPLDENKNITSDNRIVAALPTIKHLTEQGAKVILCSHLGRPKGKVNPEFSLEPVAKRLSELLGKDVKLAGDIVGESAKTLTGEMQDGDVVLLENVRFDEREEKNDPEFSRELASLTDGIYVNDAFGTAHRAHSSTAGVASYVNTAVSGYLMGKEVEELDKAISNPKRPFVVILGGLKVSDKIGVIENLLTKADEILIGGAMASTFLKAQGYDIGDSKYEEEKLEEAKRLLSLAEARNVRIVLPVDEHVANDFADNAESQFVDIKAGVPEGWQTLDIGPKTQEIFAQEVQKANTIVWNGPLGVTEFDNYRVGTEKVAKAIAGTNARCVVGGGDSAAAVKKIQKESNTTFDNIYISTGGGASLEFLEGKELPGIACLQDKCRGRSHDDDDDCR